MLPKTLGACADALYRTREKRLALQKQIKELEDTERELREHIIETLPKSDANGVAGKLCRVQVVTKQVPQVKDWDSFYAHIKKTASKGGFALLNKAVNKAAVKEIWDSGKKVPGVEAFTAVSLSMNKL